MESTAMCVGFSSVTWGRNDALTLVKDSCVCLIDCIIDRVRAFLAATVAVLFYHALGLQTVFALFNDPGFTVRF
jgi:hypothetical protein